MHELCSGLTPPNKTQCMQQNILVHGQDNKKLEDGNKKYSETQKWCRVRDGKWKC